MARTRANDPSVQYRFKVEIGTQEYAFTRASGLEMETETIEYKEGNDNLVRKVPGRTSAGTATFERGATSDTTVYELQNRIEDESLDTPRFTITVTEMDYAGSPIKSYTLKNAWVSKVTAPEFDASSSDVAIETMEVQYEDINIVNESE